MYTEKLETDINISMQIVFEFSEKLKNAPEYVSEVQKLTLNPNKAYGLKGNKGLYNSEEWWNNINKGIIETVYKKGVITEIYEAGQDNLGHSNSFKFRDKNGNEFDESMYCLRKKDFQYFQKGHYVIIYYALLELKGSEEILEEVIELAISKLPVRY